MERLKQLLEEHKKNDFPNFPDNDNLTEWIEELAEIDCYYIGLAISFINGEKVIINYDYLQELKKKLNNFSSEIKECEIFNYCSKYLLLLENIVLELKLLIPN